MSGDKSETLVPFSFQAVIDGHWEFYHDDDCGAVLDPDSKVCSVCGWRPDLQSMGARRTNKAVPLNPDPFPAVPVVSPEEAKPEEQSAVKMRRFIQEHQMVTGRNNPFTQSNLPDVALGNPTICMPNDLLRRFRNDYLLLIHFAALKCGVDADRLCQLDLLAPFLKAATEDDDEI